MGEALTKDWVPDFQAIINDLWLDATAWVQEHYTAERSADAKLVTNLVESLRAACDAGSLRMAADAANHLRKTLSRKWGL